MGYLDLNLARKRRGLLPPNGEPLPDERSPYLAADPTPQPTIPFRPRVVDPESYTGESPDVVEAGSSAQQVRPKIADPEQFTEDRIDTLQHMPLEHVGFKRRAGMALENFGQAITQGLQNAAAYGHPLSTYDAMNLIGAGISSGAPLLAGRVASRAVRDEEVGQNRERLLNFDQARQRRAAREDATLKRAKGVADYNKTLAETADIEDRPVREREKMQGDAAKEERVRAEVERHNLIMEKHQTDSLEDQKIRERETTRHNREMEKIGVLNAVALSGRTDAELRNSIGFRKYQFERDKIDKQNQAAQKEYEDADRAAKQFNDLHDYVDDLAAKLSGIQAMSPEEQKKHAAEFAQLREQKDKALAQLNEIGPTVRQKYGKHLTYNQRERFDVGPRPEPTPYGDPPESVIPERPNFQPEPSAGTSSDPAEDKTVERMRSQWDEAKHGPFDEIEARIAYRKRNRR
jgi:hypothetical protein